MIRTPREAKQALLNDIVDALRTTSFAYSAQDTPREVVDKAKHFNRMVITQVAAEHGLVIPSKPL